jgi:hypothetical protein
LKRFDRGTGLGMATTKSRIVAKLKDVVTPDEPTKTDLYAEAQRLGIKGRSKMNKGALKSAVNRRK